MLRGLAGKDNSHCSHPVQNSVVTRILQTHKTLWSLHTIHHTELLTGEKLSIPQHFILKHKSGLSLGTLKILGLNSVTIQMDFSLEFNVNLARSDPLDTGSLVFDTKYYSNYSYK